MNILIEPTGYTDNQNLYTTFSSQQCHHKQTTKMPYLHICLTTDAMVTKLGKNDGRHKRNKMAELFFFDHVK